MKLLCLIILWIANESATVRFPTFKDQDYPHLLRPCHEKHLNYSSSRMQKLCIKEHTDSKNKHDAIKIDAKDFKDLVRHSDIYVDKSLFIRAIIMSKEPIISFTYPKKWGKSINLDMVKTFFEIEVDSKGTPIPIESTWSYQYFKKGQIVLENGDSVTLERPPHINRHQDHIKRFLAQYPVIYLDLSASQPTKDDLDGFFQAFSDAIAIAFERHEYLAKVLKGKEDKEIFEKYKKGRNIGTEEMINSLQFLGKVLFDQFKKRVFIFIDGYDYMIEQAFFTVPSRIELKDAEKFLDFYSEFLHSTFEANKDYLRTGVLSGVFNVNHCFQKKGLKDIVNYNMLNKNLDPLFHGFTMLEVEQLYNELDIPGKQVKEVFDWHSGYHLGDHPKITVFNSWFIANFANTRKLEKSWAKTWSHDILPKTLELESTRKFLQAVISGSANATINRNTLDFNTDDIKFLKSVTTHEMQDTPSDRSTSIFILFYSVGYFSLDMESVLASSSKEMLIVISCKGTLNIIVEELKNYYRKELGDGICQSAKNVARGILAALHLNSWLLSWLTEPLDKLYERLPLTYYRIDQRIVDEAHFLVLLYVKSNYNFNIGFNVLYYDDEKNPQTIYMTIYNHDIGVAFSYRYKVAFHDVPEAINLCSALNPHKFFFQSKHVNLIRNGVLNIPLKGVRLSNVIFSTNPLIWSETEKKFIPTKRWSYNLAAFKDYNAGAEMDSNNDETLY